MSSDMDSGLGSDEDRRGSRTKEEKQLHNEQLLSGCFIDAASLSDDAEVVDQRRNDERRQGALIFQTSIPQFSMLQISSLGGPESTLAHHAETSTPYNSIVQLDGSEDADQARNRSPLGFYVDLSQVPDTPQDTSTSSKKNIFSMVIDFEGPKKDKPVKLSSSCIAYKKPKPKPNLLKCNGSLSSSVSSVNSLCVASTSRQSEEHETRTNDVSSISVLSASLVKNLSIASSKSSSDESSDRNVVEKSEDEPLGESMILEDCDNDDCLSSSKELEGSLFSKQPPSSEPISLDVNSDCGSSDSGNQGKEVKNVPKLQLREQIQVRLSKI